MSLEFNGLKARPGNCPTYLGEVGGDRCPHCGYWHLRPGYCAALDPVNPGYVNREALTAADVNTAVNNEAGVNVSEKRKAYMREYMRKKRAKVRE